MAEMISSAIVSEAVSQIFSSITTTTSKNKGKSDEEAVGSDGLERLEMARIKMEAALQASNRWQITDTSLLRWRKKLKRAAQGCDLVARKCRELSREEEEAEQVVRQSSFPRRVAHATKTFISSFVVSHNDHCSMANTTVVRRFERLADGAGEFIRFVQLGGTPRQNLFFDPLIGHIFAGKTLIYQVFYPGGQYHFFSVRPTIGFEERGVEAILSFMYNDGKVPKNSFGLGVMLRVSESTDIIGTTIKCLRLVRPHFKSRADVAIEQITQLPTQDFSYFAEKETSNQTHKTLVGWFRSDPLCCQGYENDVLPSCHGSSYNNSGSVNKLRLSIIFPEPVCVVFFQSHISLSEYSDLPRSTATAGYDDTSSLEKSLPLKLGMLFLPHDSTHEDLKSAGSAIEVIDEEKQQHLTHVTVNPEEFNELLLPKVVDYLHHNVKAATYQICWRSNHGSAHLCMENTRARRMLGARRTTQELRNIKNTKGLRRVQQDQQTLRWKQVTQAFLKLWIVRSSERLRGSLTTLLNQLGQN